MIFSCWANSCLSYHWWTNRLNPHEIIGLACYNAIWKSLKLQNIDFQVNVDLVTSSCLPTASAFIWSEKSLVKLSSPRTANSLPDIQGAFWSLPLTCTPHHCQMALLSSLILWWGSPGLRHDIGRFFSSWGAGAALTVTRHPALLPLLAWFAKPVALKFSMWHLFQKKEVWEIHYFGYQYLTFVRLYCAFQKIHFPHFPS